MPVPLIVFSVICSAMFCTMFKSCTFYNCFIRGHCKKTLGFYPGRVYYMCILI